MTSEAFTFALVAPVLGVLALVYTFWRSGWVTRQDAGNETMREIAGHIADGALAFL
jgi:K(+)-stimulated pyrophosphate-energized sodium pump